MAVATRHNCIKQTHCNLTDFTFKRGENIDNYVCMLLA